MTGPRCFRDDGEQIAVVETLPSPHYLRSRRSRTYIDHGFGKRILVLGLYLTTSRDSGYCYLLGQYRWTCWVPSHAVAIQPLVFHAAQPYLRDICIRLHRPGFTHIPTACAFRGSETGFLCGFSHCIRLLSYT